MQQRKHEFIDGLIEIGAFHLGNFVLKSGAPSPYYLDLRLLISHPRLLRLASELLWEKVAHLEFDLLCGVPYAALPIATCLSVFYDRPMILRRKAAKEYGTKKILEGSYKAGQTCLIVEDVLSSGASVLETTEILIEHELIVHDVALLVDREQGGKRTLADQGISVHSLLTIREIITHLSESKRFPKKEIDTVFSYLAEMQR